MSESVLHVYKCPSCGGAVAYDAELGKLACRWCGNVYDADRLQAKEVSTSLQGYQCSECGAQVMTDDFIAAVTCPYCGNNEVAPHRFDGVFAPDSIIPFTVTKQQAIERYEDLLSSKAYLPNDFGKKSSIVSVQGVYVPFWLQAGRVDFDFTWYCLDHVGKDAKTIYQRRAGTFSFSRVPADGSQRMRDDMMDSVEPYDYSALKPFSTEFLPGFVAERYTVDKADIVNRIKTRVANTACHESAKTIDPKWTVKVYESKYSSSTVTFGTFEQALLPVWLIVVKYKGTKYLVGVNGQTGKVAVNLPIDAWKKGKKTGIAVVKDVAMTLTVLAFGGLLVFGGLWADGLDFSKVELTTQMAIWLAVVAAFGIIMVVAFALEAYFKARGEVKSSMHNVSESKDADDFTGSLTLTLSAAEKGPKVS